MTLRRKSGAQPKPLKFARVPHPAMRQPCIEIVSHARSRKGYVKLRPRNGQRANHVHAHRLAYLSKHGPASLPDGWEVDHICKNRACVNRSHLRVLDRSDHKRVTNAERYADLEEAARCYWLATGCDFASLAEYAGRSLSTVRRWRNRWALEDQGDE